MEVPSPERTAYPTPAADAATAAVACGCASSRSVLEYKSASGLKLCAISKAGMGIIKMATSQWRMKEKKRVVRPSSTGNRQPSSERFSCKKSPLEQLTAMLLHGQPFAELSGSQPRPDKPCCAKPQNRRRIVVLGAPRVGKTSILRRFLRDTFEEQYEPTSEDFHRKLYQIRGETYQVDILDASRERGFPARRRLSILTGDIFLLVFSVDDRSSFEEVRALRKEILAAKSKVLKNDADLRVPTIICANKTDLEPGKRVVCWGEVCRAFGEDCALFETSAKTCANLEEAFEALAKRGGLPSETRPSQHRKISIRSYQALRAGRRAGRSGRAPGVDAPYGALHPLARRPSFSSDLRQVMGHDSSHKRSKQPEKCHIQ